MQSQLKNSDGPACSPLSASPPVKVRDLPKRFILEQLALQYGQTPPPEIVETDYTLWQCAETGLEFAWPMLPGSAAFYEWVSSFAAYYPGIRWEYKKVRQILETKKIPHVKLKVLDAGCGKGDFLSGLEFIPGERRFALDLNRPAVEACRKLGFQAFCGTIEAAMDTQFLKQAEFSAVTSFHCLEHVSQPVEFVRTLLKMVAPGGSVFVSTPYSPMFTEIDFFDVLNHPPHHLTRWNLKAYQRLAAILDVEMRYYIPPAGAWKRAMRAFWVSRHGSGAKINKAKLLADLMRKFPDFLRLHQMQLERERANQGIGSDVILVELIAK